MASQVPTESEAWKRHSYDDTRLNERRMNHQGLCNVMFELGMLSGVPKDQIRGHVDREFATADSLKDGTLIDHHEFTVWFDGALRRRSQPQQQAPAYGIPAPYGAPQQQQYPPPAAAGYAPPQPYYPPQQPAYAQPQYAPPQPAYAPPPQPMYAQPQYAPPPMYAQPQYAQPQYAQPQYAPAPMMYQQQPQMAYAQGGYGNRGGGMSSGMSTGLAVGGGLLAGMMLEDVFFD